MRRKKRKRLLKAGSQSLEELFVPVLFVESAITRIARLPAFFHFAMGFDEHLQGGPDAALKDSCFKKQHGLFIDGRYHPSTFFLVHITVLETHIKIYCRFRGYSVILSNYAERLLGL